MEWKDPFAHHISDKGLISKICKELIQINNRKQIIQLKNGQRNGHFSKEDIQMTNRYVKRCSTSLIIREMQIKTTVRHHFTSVRMANIKKINIKP